MPGEEGWTVALNLEGFEVVQAEVDRQLRQVRLTVVPQWPVAVCPHCGQVSTQIHQTRELDGIHDLPVADRAVRLVVRVPQFWCGPCARAFTPKLPEVAEGDGHVRCQREPADRQLAWVGIVRHGVARVDVRHACKLEHPELIPRRISVHTRRAKPLKHLTHRRHLDHRATRPA